MNQENINNLYTYRGREQDLEDIKAKEKDFYAGRINYEEMIQFLENIANAQNETNKRKIECWLNVFRGMLCHRNANYSYINFHHELGDQAAESDEYLSRTEMLHLLAKSQYKEKLYKNEESSLLNYEKALQDWHVDSRYLDENTIMKLRLDIKYRQALRMEDDAAREKSLAKIEKEYEYLMRETKDAGKRSETESVWLAHKWAKRKWIDHLFNVYHALPLDDHKDKIDFQAVYGKNNASFGLKTLSQSSELKDFNAAYRAREEEKLRGKNIRLLELDSLDMRTAWQLGERESELSGSDKASFTKLLNSIFGQITQHLPIEVKSKKIEQNSRELKLTDKTIISHYSSVPILVKLGYLASGNVNTDGVIAAKNNLAADLKKSRGRDIKNKIKEILKQGS